MKRLMAMVLAGGVVLAGASLRAETITINDVSGAAGSVVPVPVYISGGANVSAVALAFSVGDGGPVLGGTQTISIKSVDYLTGTIWSGQALAPVVEVPALPAQSATVVEISLGTPGANVAASGLLMTFMLDLASATPEVLTMGLNPDAKGKTAASDASHDSLTLSFVSGNLTVTPEPSTIAMLLGFAGVGLVACLHKKIARRSAP